MSSTISSTELVSTATTFEWAGTANASPTVQRINGAVVATNVVRDPETTTTAGWSFPGSASAAVVNGHLRVTPSGTATSYVYPAPTADVANPSGGRFATAPGQSVTARVEVTNPNASATIWAALGSAFYNDQGAQSGAATALTPRQAIAPGATVTFELSTITPPDATTPVTGLLPLVYAYGTVNGGIIPASSLWESTHWQVEIGPTSPSSTPLRYFTGATANTTVSVPRTSTPVLVTGYDSVRASTNVFQDVLGRSNPDVSLSPAGLRSGTLTCLFASEVEAYECERMHIGTAVLTFNDSDLQTVGMDYVLGGSIRRQLDPESRLYWTVAIDYQEVRA